jgi:hypothetical protein
METPYVHQQGLVELKLGVSNSLQVCKKFTTNVTKNIHNVHMHNIPPRDIHPLNVTSISANYICKKLKGKVINAHAQQLSQP